MFTLDLILLHIKQLKTLLAFGKLLLGQGQTCKKKTFCYIEINGQYFEKFTSDLSNTL